MYEFYVNNEKVKECNSIIEYAKHCCVLGNSVSWQVYHYGKLFHEFKKD